MLRLAQEGSWYGGNARNFYEPVRDAAMSRRIASGASARGRSTFEPGCARLRPARDGALAAESPEVHAAARGGQVVPAVLRGNYGIVRRWHVRGGGDARSARTRCTCRRGRADARFGPPEASRPTKNYPNRSPSTPRFLHGCPRGLSRHIHARCYPSRRHEPLRVHRGLGGRSNVRKCDQRGNRSRTYPFLSSRVSVDTG